jgi:hypothetical protein
MAATSVRIGGNSSRTLLQFQSNLLQFQSNLLQFRLYLLQIQNMLAAIPVHTRKAADKLVFISKNFEINQCASVLKQPHAGARVWLLSLANLCSKPPLFVFSRFFSILFQQRSPTNGFELDRIA